MPAQSRDERIELLEKSANAMGGVAWALAIVGILAGSVAANDVDPGGGGAAAAVFATTSGTYVIAAAGMMIARAVTLLALSHTLDD